VDERPIRVMVVEDTPHVRRMLRSMLELDGFAVVAEAADAAEAVLLAGQTKPDVIIVDYRMPDTDGLETARLLRAREPGQVVVLYTAYIDGELERRAADAGIALVLGKEAGLEPLERFISESFPDRG
jgi:DNA-binding NarL/FixJ family response regulator